MNKNLALGALMLLFGSALVGCQNTAEGVAKDTDKNTAEVQKAADTAGKEVSKAADAAGHEVAKAGENAGDALTLTPKVKNAIINDTMYTADKNNSIDVDTKDNIVHLKGTVVSNDMKKKAQEVAEKTIKEAGATNTVSNELVVQKH